MSRRRKQSKTPKVTIRDLFWFTLLVAVVLILLPVKLDYKRKRAQLELAEKMNVMRSLDLKEQEAFREEEYRQRLERIKQREFELDMVEEGLYRLDVDLPLDVFAHPSARTP